MNKYLLSICGVAVFATLSACSSASGEGGSTNTSTAPGTLIYSPPLRIASLTAADFSAELSASSTGSRLLQLAGAPACGVDFYYIDYQTRGAAGENATSSGAVMVPTGSAACTGARPVVLYAHGTTVDKFYNIADISNPANAEGALLAAVFAAQGFIVVAPNYAGYDTSSLGYHPYLNASQQSAEMVNALSAARTALPQLIGAPVSDSGALFLTGYSQGGYVAMATARALEAAGQIPTATAPMSGPYALEAFGDAIFYGNVNIGSTIFAPLMVTSYQHAYHDLYASTGDIFSSNYATGIDTLLPTTSTLSGLFTSGKLPQLWLFDSNTPVTGNASLDAALAVPANPLFASGFGASPLVTNNYRVRYVLDAVANPDGAVPSPSAGVPVAATAPTQALRHALWLNDLRNNAPGPWFPHSPMLMCGGGQDPTVFYSVNTGTMQAYWGALPLPPGLINTLDVNAPPSGQFAQLQGAFQLSQANELAALQVPPPNGPGLTLAQAQQQLVSEYHGAVAPFCTVGARAFFQYVLSL